MEKINRGKKLFPATKMQFKPWFSEKVLGGLCELYTPSSRGRPDRKSVSGLSYYSKHACVVREHLVLCSLISITEQMNDVD